MDVVNNSTRNQSENNDGTKTISSTTERILVIVAVVVGLIVLQIVGCVICYKDKWLAKKKAKKSQQANPVPLQAIEVTEILTTVRPPKKGKVPLEDNTNNSEGLVELLSRNAEPGVNERANEGSVGQPPIVEVHRPNDVPEDGGGNIQVR